MFQKYAESLSHVAGIQFEKFKGTKIAASPTDRNSPSILLTGLQESKMFMEPPPSEDFDDIDVLVLVAASGIGKSRAVFQYLCEKFGLYFVPTSISLKEQSYQFGPRDFLGIENKIPTLRDGDYFNNQEIVNQYVK